MGALSAAGPEPNKSIGSLSGICSASDVDPAEGRNSPTRFQSKIGRFPDAPVLHQLPGHCGQHVVIAIQCLQAFGGELAFHSQMPREASCPSDADRLPASSRYRRRTSLPPAASGQCARSAGWPAAGYAASSRSRGTGWSETPAGRGPSRPAWDGRWRRRYRASTARGTRLPACAWACSPEAQPLEYLLHEAAFPGERLRHACWCKPRTPGTCARGRAGT